MSTKNEIQTEAEKKIGIIFDKNLPVKFKKKFDYKPNHLSLLTYDLVGLIYYLSLKNEASEIYKSFKTKDIFAFFLICYHVF